MAGVTPADIDVREIYDCYTYTTLITLEDYGFCAKGEGGAARRASGALGPGGALPTNTGGGQLSSYYLWGMTPLSEAVIQVRGQGGERQVDRHEVGRSSAATAASSTSTARSCSEPSRAERGDHGRLPHRTRRRVGPVLRRRPRRSAADQALRGVRPPATRRARSAAPTATSWSGADAAGTATLVTWAVDDGTSISPAAGQRAPATARSSASSSSPRARG